MQLVLARARSFIQKHALFFVWLVGVGYYGWIISWMFGIRTGEIVQGTSAKIIQFITLFLMAGIFALGPLLFAILAKRQKLNLKKGTDWLLVPTSWTVAEFVRATIFSLFVWGPGGRVGPYWTFGNVGYWLVNSKLIFIARWGGLHMLTFCAVALICAIWLLYRYSRIAPLLYVSLVISGLALSGWAIWSQANGPQQTVAAIQFGPTFDQDAYSKQANQLLRTLPAHTVDLLILPEYSHLWERNSAADTTAVKQALTTRGVAIDSQRETTATHGLGHNLITWREPSGRVLTSHEKWFLIPGGEYIPYSYQLVLAYAGQDNLIKHFNQQKLVDPGTKQEVPFAYNGISYGSHACSAVIAPELYQPLVAQGATILTNSASLDTLGVGGFYQSQAKTMARLHAVANARPFVQASRGSLSYLIDHNGHFVAQTQANTYDVINGKLVTNTKQTVYSRFGDWFVYLCMLVVVQRFIMLYKYGIIQAKRKRKGSNGKK